MSQGRWISPDPAGLGVVDITNSQTWNRYSYAGNDPADAVDSSGLCTIFIGGVRDNRNNPALNAAADSVGGIYVAAYDGNSTLGALISIAAQALVGPNGSSQDVANAMNAIANDPNGIQIVAFSGGAQSFSSAAQSSGQMDPQEGGEWSAVAPLISQDALGNISQITYLSPGLGPFGHLYKGADTTVFHGHGLKDFGATFFARLSGNGGEGLPCNHNFGCEFSALDESITSNLTSCPGKTPNGGNGGGGNGNGQAGIPSCEIVWLDECDSEGDCYSVPVFVCGGGGGGHGHSVP
jgi:hypothetical protein